MKKSTKLNIVNRDLKFKPVSLAEPTNHFYLLVSAEVDSASFSLFLTTSRKKKQLIKQCKQSCNLILEGNDIASAVVFRAQLIPPGRGKFLEQRKGKVHIAKFDVAILIEAKTLETINSIKESDAYKQMKTAIHDASTCTLIVTARNVKNIGLVDHKKQGVFLFNYFFADSLQQNLEVWEYTAGWFQQETGLDNSTVLLPMEQQQSNYAIINHCRWDKWADIIPSLIFKKTFHSYVLDNFYANNVAAMPVLYKMA